MIHLFVFSFILYCNFYPLFICSCKCSILYTLSDNVVFPTLFSGVLKSCISVDNNPETGSLHMLEDCVSAVLKLPKDMQSQNHNTDIKVCLSLINSIHSNFKSSLYFPTCSILEE